MIYILFNTYLHISSGIFCIGLVWNFVRPWPLAWWAAYWHVVGVWAPLVLGVFTTVWFTIGGLRDLRHFFSALAVAQRDNRDDGRVASDSKP